jgi:hypothetical protein
VKGYLDALEDILQRSTNTRSIDRLRVTVTGSRDGWPPTPRPLVLSLGVVYDWFGRDVRLAHGKARGVDAAADRIARGRGWQVMPYPVKSHEWDVYGGQAGHMRNARMLEAEQPHLVLALIWRGSRGSTGCADNATARGIPVVRIDEELALLPRRASL